MKQAYKARRFRNFREIINRSAQKYGRRAAFVLKREGKKPAFISYRELKERYYSLCEYFLCQGLLGERIAVMGKNSPAWVISYLAASTVGVAVPLDRELERAEVEDFCSAADCRLLCLGDEVMNAFTPWPMQLSAHSFSEIMQITENRATKGGCRRVDSLTLDKNQMQVLLFTSGTMGSSKGVCLSQANICACIHSTVRTVKIKKRDRMLSILPLHHTYECTLNCLLPLSRGASIAYCDGPARIERNLREYHPSVLLFVPALLKMLSKRLVGGIAGRLPRRYRARLESEGLPAIGSFPWYLRRLIGRRVRRKLGGRLRLIIVGAAAMEAGIGAAFSVFGIRVLQGYGLTEAAPLLAGNSDFFSEDGSVGRAVPGVTLKIDRPNHFGVGEILARGENIMLGYYRDAEATERALGGGWLHTGDLGCFTEDGTLYIKGRKKSVIIADNGKNIYPEELEGRLSAYPEVGEALVLGGESRGDICVRAKIFPNLDFIKEQLGRWPTAEEIEGRIREIVREVNHHIPTYKHIKVFEVLKTALEKTSTRKIKRYGENMG